MVWRVNDPQGNEAHKVKYKALRYMRGRGLDLGCGPFKVWNHAIGIDNGHHWGHHQAQVPYIATDSCEKLTVFADNSMDFVFSSHLLEHIHDTLPTLREWFRVVKPGGYLILYLPHKELYPNCGEPGANPDHKHDFLPEDIISHMRLSGSWDLVVNETRNTDNGEGMPGNEYSFFQVYQKLDTKKKEHRFSCDKPRPEKTACVVRYGGFGDHLQASSILNQLKAKGYHITYHCVPSGEELLRHHPAIDEFYIVDRGVVPEQDLDPLWDHLRGEYDLFINLTESVEGTLLPHHQRIAFNWPYSIRQKYLNRNYVEWTHELAQLPYKPDIHFYATDEEIAQAKATAEEMGGFNIMYSLSGSSMHKFYPWQDQVIARVLKEIPEARIMLVGDAACQVLEVGWEDEPRVFERSDKLKMRDALALAQQMDVVMGPETGVLNAVSFEDNAKVVMLSHSSVENLTRDWVNTYSMIPDRNMSPCYPCHQLHYNRSICPREESTQAAMCAAAIDPAKVYDAIHRAYLKWSENNEPGSDDNRLSA